MERVAQSRYYSNDKLTEKCGVFGIHGNNEAVNLTYNGLVNINNRGHDEAAMVDEFGNRIGGQGFVVNALPLDQLALLSGSTALGHVLYSTSRVEGHRHPQPVPRYIKNGHYFYLAHNGTIPSTIGLERLVDSQGTDPSIFNDSELITEAMVPYLRQDASIEEAFWEVKERSGIDGAFTLLMKYKDKMTMIKDRCGLKPGGYAFLDEGMAFSSESSGLIGVDYRGWTELGAGLSITVDKDGLRNPVQMYIPDRRFDIWEMIYFMRPTSFIDGVLIRDFRRQLGRNLAKEHPSNADAVIPVMDSGEDSAIGYAEESGVPLKYILVKKSNKGRSFIAAAQLTREEIVKDKFEEIQKGSLKGLNLDTEDDSQVRATTSPIINDMLREAGADLIGNRYAAPPILFPDFYGTDTPNQRDLKASYMSMEQLRDYTRCDSIAYLSLEGLYKTILEITGMPISSYNFSCLTGEYPINIGERANEIVYPQMQLASV